MSRWCNAPYGDPTKVDLLAFARTAGIHASRWLFLSHLRRFPQMSPHSNVATFVGLHSPTISKFIGKIVAMIIKIIEMLTIMGKTIIKFIKAFTEGGITWRTWNGSTSIVDQNVSVDNVLSNPHRNNGASKVLGIFCF